MICYRVVKLNREHMTVTVVTTDNECAFELPVTTLIDHEGDETNDWKDTAMYVCGSGDLHLTVKYGNLPTYH